MRTHSAAHECFADAVFGLSAALDLLYVWGLLGRASYSTEPFRLVPSNTHARSETNTPTTTDNSPRAGILLSRPHVRKEVLVDEIERAQLCARCGAVRFDMREVGEQRAKQRLLREIEAAPVKVLRRTNTSWAAAQRA